VCRVVLTSVPRGSGSGRSVVIRDLLKYHRLSPQMVSVLLRSQEGSVPYGTNRTMEALHQRGLTVKEGGPYTVPLTDKGLKVFRIMMDRTFPAAYMRTEDFRWLCPHCMMKLPGDLAGFSRIYLEDMKLGELRYRCDDCHAHLDRGDR